jgi:peroxiredoxin Q/BCP
MKLQVHDIAPQFNLPDQEGKLHKLTDYKGQWLVLYFYPKDDTPGCTKEACGFRDNLPKFSKLKAQVFGFSADSVEKHKKFTLKYKLPFTLLSDESKKTLTDYGVWAEKKFLGKKYMGILRTTFLVDPKGKIAKIYENVKPVGHAEEVLKDLAASQKVT